MDKEELRVFLLEPKLAFLQKIFEKAPSEELEELLSFSGKIEKCFDEFNLAYDAFTPEGIIKIALSGKGFSDIVELIEVIFKVIVKSEDADG